MKGVEWDKRDMLTKAINPVVYLTIDYTYSNWPQCFSENRGSL